MFSIQRFLSKGDRFFDLLEASAEEARQAVYALTAMINSPQEEWALDKFILLRRQEKQINEETTALLCSTFITPLEREDIESLSSALGRIPKVIKKFAQRLLLAEGRITTEMFRGQLALVEQAIETVYVMVQQLRHGPKLDKIQADNGQLHVCEGEADKLMLELLRQLYTDQYTPLQMILLRDLFELLEKVIDRCRDAGNVIFQIVLKNS